jgi:transcription antitermination factor NusG
VPSEKIALKKHEYTHVKNRGEEEKSMEKWEQSDKTRPKPAAPGSAMSKFREKYYDPNGGAEISRLDKRPTTPLPPGGDPVNAPRGPRPSSPYFPSVTEAKGESRGESGEAYGTGSLGSSQTEWVNIVTGDIFVRNKEGKIVTKDKSYGIVLVKAHIDNRLLECFRGCGMSQWYGAIPELKTPQPIGEEEWMGFIAAFTPKEEKAQLAEQKKQETPSTPVDPATITFKRDDHVEVHDGPYAGKRGTVDEIKADQGKAIITLITNSARGEEIRQRVAVPLSAIGFAPVPKPVKPPLYDDLDIGLDNEPEDGHDIQGELEQIRREATAIDRGSLRRKS